MTQLRRTVLSIVLLTLTTSARAQACSTSEIRMTSESGMALKASEDGLEFAEVKKLVKNIPFSLNGQLACVEQRDSLEIKHRQSEDGLSGTLGVVLPKAEFSGVAEGRVDTYAYVQPNESNQIETMIHLVSVICADETTLGIQGFSGRFSETAVAPLRVNTSTRLFIATGIAAKQLQSRIAGGLGEVPAALKEIFQKRVGKASLKALKQQTLKMPEVLLSQELSTNAGVATKSTLTTIDLDRYACTQHFRETMKEFSIENLSNTLRSSSLEAHHDGRRGTLTIKWGRP